MAEEKKPTALVATALCGVFLFLTGAILPLISAAHPWITALRWAGLLALLFASLALLMGYQSLLFGISAKTFAINEGLLPQDPAFTKFFLVLNLERGLVIGALTFVAGAALLLDAVWQWRAVNLGHLDYTHTMRWVIPGVTLAALGFQTILSSFLVSMLGLHKR